MSEETAKPRWYVPTPGRFVVGLLALQVCFLLADRLSLFGCERGNPWNVLYAMAALLVGILVGLIWFGASLLLRLRFQFGLKTLFVLSLAVAVPCAWLSWEMQQAEIQRESVEVIGGTWRVRYDYQLDANGWYLYSFPPEPLAPRWLQRLLGDDFFTDVVAASVDNLDERVVAHLKRLPRLKYLKVYGTETGLTEADLGHLKQLNLEELHVSFLTIDDDDAREIENVLPGCRVVRYVGFIVSTKDPPGPFALSPCRRRISYSLDNLDWKQLQKRTPHDDDGIDELW